MNALGWVILGVVWVVFVSPIAAIVVARVIRAGRGPDPGR